MNINEENWKYCMKIQMNKMKIIYKIQKRNEKFIKETVFLWKFYVFLCSFK